MINNIKLLLVAILAVATYFTGYYNGNQVRNAHCEYIEDCLQFEINVVDLHNKLLLRLYNDSPKGYDDFIKTLPEYINLHNYIGGDWEDLIELSCDSIITYEK